MKMFKILAALQPEIGLSLSYHQRKRQISFAICALSGMVLALSLAPIRRVAYCAVS
jgi:hypothetical protein